MWTAARRPRRSASTAPSPGSAPAGTPFLSLLLYVMCQAGLDLWLASLYLSMSFCSIGALVQAANSVCGTIQAEHFPGSVHTSCMATMQYASCTVLLLTVTMAAV